jgi:hypothetical protein
MVGIRKCSEESCDIGGDEADGLGRLSFIRLKTGIRLGLYCCCRGVDKSPGTGGLGGRTANGLKESVRLMRLKMGIRHGLY